MKWNNYKLKAETAEELEQVKTPAGMRQRILRASHDDPLIHRVLDLAWREGLSGEDTYTLLAYHALVQKEQLEEYRLEELWTSLKPPSIVVDVPRPK